MSNPKIYRNPDLRQNPAFDIFSRQRFAPGTKEPGTWHPGHEVSQNGQPLATLRKKGQDLHDPGTRHEFCQPFYGTRLYQPVGANPLGILKGFSRYVITQSQSSGISFSLPFSLYLTFVKEGSCLFS